MNSHKRGRRQWSCAGVKIQLAALLFWAALWAACAPSFAHAAPPSVECESPLWLRNSIRGSLGAVWRELQGSSLSSGASRNALALVASRLFPGYRVRILSTGVIQLTPERQWRWKLSLVSPERALRMADPLSKWIRDDMAQAVPLIEEALRNVPPEALNWGADSFQAVLDSIMERTAPGWKCSARGRGSDGEAELEISLYPREPVLLAVSPVTISSSIPQILADKINEKTLSQLSPLTGMPVAWIARHEKSIVEWLSKEQLSDSWIKALRASTSSSLSVKPITKVTTNVESTTYSLRGWLSAHAGGGQARLEAGIHLGRFFTLKKGFMGEFYGEGILGLEEWDPVGRAGIRLSPCRSLWLGFEISTEESARYWYRLWIQGAGAGPYGWLRYSENSDLEAALGYRMNRYVSFEFYYDNRQDDRLSLRAISDI